jgi:hypothetical protein
MHGATLKTFIGINLFVQDGEDVFQVDLEVVNFWM